VLPYFSTPVPPDLAGPLGAKGHAIQAAVLISRFLQHLQNAACVRNEGVAHGIDLADAVHAAHRHDHGRCAVFQACAHGRCAAHHAGVAALRHHLHACLGAGLDHSGHFLGGPWLHHSHHITSVASTPVFDEGGHVHRLGEHMRGADQLTQFFQQRGMGWIHFNTSSRFCLSIWRVTFCMRLFQIRLIMLARLHSIAP
jgi:hypothetical protein